MENSYQISHLKQYLYKWLLVCVTQHSIPNKDTSSRTFGLNLISLFFIFDFHSEIVGVFNSPYFILLKLFIFTETSHQSQSLLLGYVIAFLGLETKI